MVKIDIIVYPGCDELDVIGPFEALSSAKKFGADFEIRLVSLYDDKFNISSHGLKFETNCKYQLGEQDILVIPGGAWLAKGPVGAWAEFQKGYILDVLKQTHQSAKPPIIASVCTGSMLLAHAGIIGKRRATTHHSCWDQIEKLGVILVKERVVVADETLITAGGVTSGIDLGVYLTSKYASKDIASKVTDVLEYEVFVPKE